MDENVQIPPNLLIRLKKAADAVERSTDVRVISHNDADGISAAGVICSFLFRKSKPFHCTMAKGFDEKQVKESIQGCDLLIIADMGSNDLMTLESLGIPVVVLDHHRPERDSEKIIHVNPHIFGIDGATSGCASSLALLLAITVSENNWDLSWMTFGGIVGDRQHMRGMSGVNTYLFQEAAKRKFIEERSGQIITDGLLKDALYTTSDPFVVGVSGDHQGVSDVLTEANVLDNLHYESLEQNQQMKLNSLLMLKLLEQGSTLANFEELLCNRYFSADGKVHCKDLADTLTACGKSESQALGLAMLMGDKKAANDANALSDKYSMTLLQTSIEVQSKGMLQAQHIQYFICPNQDVSSETCSVMMQWVGDRSKPTLSLSHKGGDVRISSRANKHIVDDLGVDLGAALKAACAIAGGSGGGHNVASGGKIPLGKEEAFIKDVDRLVGEQKAAKLNLGK
jgi:single-stranded-DNA-specific exonuclease